MLPILALLPGLLAAEVIQRSLQIEEGGTSYTQTVTFDFDNRVQIIDVPAHNNIVHSRSHFYFNQVPQYTFTFALNKYFCRAKLSSPTLTMATAT